jgi:hypothetical protein
MADAHANFAYSTLTNAPGTTGTTFSVQTGDGAKFPTPPFNATVWPAGVQPISTNAEIVRVNTIATDNLTVDARGPATTQENSTNQTVAAGWQIAATITAKTITDLEAPLSVTLLTYQNRQYGASSVYSTSYYQNSVWLTPFRIPAGNYVSASSFVILQMFSGSVSSNTSGTFGETIRWALYSNNTSNSTSFNTFSSGSVTGQAMLSGTASVSYNFNGAQSQGANSTILSTNFMGYRLVPVNINTLLSPGLYAYGVALSTSGGGWASFVRTGGLIMDNPAAIAMGSVGQVTNTSIGFQDAGIYSVTSGSVPAAFGMSEIRGMSNVVPYVKFGAV